MHIMKKSKSPPIATSVKSDKLVKKRRNQIVLSAIKLFSRKGFHKTTIRYLAEDAGISQGNIYEYIGSKEDIFFLIHDFMANLAIDTLNRNTKDIDNPLERLRRLIRSEFNLMYEWADAILLIYQEGHILKKSLLKKLLEREAEHINIFEQTIDECIEKKFIRNFNTKVAANLIKVMVDAWVLKRWNLRGNVTQLEMERSIIDLIFHGFLKSDKFPLQPLQEIRPLEGKSIFVMNCGGALTGEFICPYLSSKGARLAVYYDSFRGDHEHIKIDSQDQILFKIFSAEENGPMTETLFKQIIKDFGPIDIFIHELGISDLETDKSLTNQAVIEMLNKNLSMAQNLAPKLKAEMSKRGSGRIIYITPWAWSRNIDSLFYEIIKEATIALTKKMAKDLAPSRINVNCVVPGFISKIKASNSQKELESQIMNKIPWGQLGEMTDIIEAITFLITDSSKYLTGQILEVTGGNIQL